MSDPLQRQRKMVEQFPDNELARFSLGKALFDQEQYAEAKEHFGIALKKKPDWMAVQILLARCELNLGNKGLAKTGLLRARELAIKQNHEGPRAEVEQLLEDLAADEPA
jgi:Flp pilus assembly protein TadD